VSVLPPVGARDSFKEQGQALRCSALASPVLFALKAGQRAAVSHSEAASPAPVKE